MTTVALVLKSGGCYTNEYVDKLSNAIHNNTTVTHKIVCLTDVEFDLLLVDSYPLLNNWPGWWSKIELFREDLKLNNCVYFDLDTIILGNIDELLNLANRGGFYVLRNFNQRENLPAFRINSATGVVVGNFSNHSYLYTAFSQDAQKEISKTRKGWKAGDQGFIYDNLKQQADSIQDNLPENYIVGRKITRDGTKIPPEARVLAWSGEPRLHQIPSLWSQYGQ